MSRPRRISRPHAPHFSYTHPLAEAATRRCKTEHPLYRSGKNKVACGRCWEAVIRADALLAADVQLPQHPPAFDPKLVDQVAVDRAMNGEAPAPNLTPTERDMAVRKLRDQGLKRSEIALRLSVSKSIVDRALAERSERPPPVLSIAAA
ncbi:hypothetical protein [Glycomyces buryatensis]|uniref:Helix-turn-helix domain-containing protein n=1 Tax=Glycomyces buryatensis TaxID=2570927 RepID=A0A4V4HS77_9ACTN|nr:hypothetical protein [Glycomyces buryatensis]THV40586.1 hypothetical protein FAB82_15075 [Glycomyces buryatensis]